MHFPRVRLRFRFLAPEVHHGSLAPLIDDLSCDIDDVEQERSIVCSLAGVLVVHGVDRTLEYINYLTREAIKSSPS